MNREPRSNASSPRRVSARARVLLAAAIAATGFAADPASAGSEGAGTTAANFLSVGSGAGVLGMGGAGLGLDGGLAAAGWNPAVLGRLGATEIVFSHAGLGEQTAQEWAGLAGRLRFAGLSGAVTGLFQSEGSFEGRDALNNPTGSFDVSSLALGFGIARALGPFATAGVGLKYASENLGGVRGSGVTFDAGLQVRSGGFGFGAAAQNAFGRMNYAGARYDFPSSYGLGVSYEHSASGLRVALDMNFPPAYYSDVRGGVEWRWNDRFALRTGYRAELGADGGEPLGGPTFGMGAGVRGMWFDYGYLVGSGASQHRIGITFHPGALVLPAAEPAHGGNETGYASAGAPATHKADAPASATPPASPRATPSASAPTTATPPASPRATPSVGAPASAAAPPPTGPSASAMPPVSPRGTPSASTSASTTQPASPPASAGASATPGGRSTASAPATASPPSPARAVASPGASAAGPAAVKVSSAPPTYTQRAKAARGTGEASASDRKTAAAETGSSATPRPPVAPQASWSASAATKRDSTTAAKASPAAGATTAATPKPGAGAPGKPDSAAQQSAATGPGTPPSPPAVSGSRPERVRVKNGQTMADIARKYGTSVAAIMMENNLVSDRVRPGQVLRLPAK